MIIDVNLLKFLQQCVQLVYELLFIFRAGETNLKAEWGASYFAFFFSREKKKGDF